PGETTRHLKETRISVSNTAKISSSVQAGCTESHLTCVRSLFYVVFALPSFSITHFPHARSELNCSVVFKKEVVRVPTKSRKVWNKEILEKRFS
ncbi:hypothetical protein AMECASPLE_013013, partial [Ameca splendens]